MKIVYCIASLASKGGTEKVLLSKASYLADHGYDVTIVISDQRKLPLAYPVSDNVNIIDLQVTRVLTGTIKFVGFFQNVLTLRKLYQKEIGKLRPDIIVVMERGYEDFVIPYILKPVPKVREYHFSRKASSFLESQLPILLKSKKRLIRKLYERQYKKYHQFVILTHKDRPFWNNWKHITVIPNMIEDLAISEINDVCSRPKNIIAVGSMAEDRKNFSALIDIWKDIESNYPDWHLNIFGDGPYKPHYLEQIKQLNLKNIHLKGISNMITQEYQNAQLFVMTSKGEGFGMVIIEAQQQGLPCIVYDCYCGPSDILKNNNGGFLIKMNDKEDFKEKLTSLMLNENLLKGKSAEAYQNAQQYLPENVMPSWIDLFNNLIKK